MKTSYSLLMSCGQNKFLVVNIVVVVIFLVNTVFFHVYRVGRDKPEVENVPGLELNRLRTRRVEGDFPAAALRLKLRAGAEGNPPPKTQGKRAPGKQRPAKKGPDLSKIATSDKWIVVSLSHFNKSWGIFNQSYLSFLDTIHGWTSVIVGKAADSNHGCRSCLVFPTPAHRGPTPTILKAFVTAITHGARRIYVMTSLHHVTSALKRMTSPNIRGIIYSGKVPFKPCSHFVQPLLSSGRSFPECHDSNWVYAYSTGEFPDRNVIGLCEECGRSFPVNGSLGSGSNPTNNILYCDPTTPNVAVNPESFVESVFENSLWRYESFWAMFFYGMKYTPWSSSREKLKMSHVIQRLLWEINVSMSFVRSHDLDFEKYDSINMNETKYGYSFERDYYNIESKLCRWRDLTMDIHILGQFLYQWKCDENLTIDQCVTGLSDSLYRSSLIDDDQYKTMYRFVNILNGTLYEYPERPTGPAISVGSYIGSKSKNLRFWPSARRRTWGQNPFHDVCTRFFDRQYENVKADGDIKNSSTTPSSLSSLPSSSSSSSSPLTPMVSPLAEETTSNDEKDKAAKERKTNSSRLQGLDKIVLVIVFQSNNPSLQIQMVNFYDYMYGRHFRNIVYCTSGEDKIEMFSKMYPQPLTFIDLKVSDTSVHPYLCMSEVMRMHHSSVDGYLHLDSDTLLNPWTIQNNLRSHRGKTWINAGTMKTRLFEQEVKTANTRLGQIWKDKGHGRIALNSSLQDLMFISRVIDQHFGDTNSTSNRDILEYLEKYNKIVKMFIASFNSNNSGSDSRTPKMSQFEIRLGICLVFYVPSKHREHFIVLADEFSRYRVHSYIVVPTMMKYLDSNFLELNGTISTTHHTNSILAAYKSHHAFLHPWEMRLLSAPKRSQFMCNDFLGRVEASLWD